MAHATTGPASALTAAVRVRCAEISAAWPRAARGDTRAVHGARTASRRLRELLPVVEKAAPDGGALRLRRDARRLTRALGKVRELDVAIEVLADETIGRSATVAEVAAADRVLEAERVRARSILRDRLAKLNNSAWRARADRLLKALAGIPARHAWEAVLAKRLRRRALRVLDAVDAAGTLYAPEPLHRVRIAAKKLRYSLELACDVAGLPVEPLVASVRFVQDRLGRIHDLHVLDQHIRAMTWPGGRRASAVQARAALLSALERECREHHAVYLARRDALSTVARHAGNVVAASLTGRRHPARMRLSRRSARSGRTKMAAAR